MDSDRKSWQNLFDSLGGFNSGQNTVPGGARSVMAGFIGNEKNLAVYDAKLAAYQKKQAVTWDGVQKGYITSTHTGYLDRAAEYATQAIVYAGLLYGGYVAGSQVAAGGSSTAATATTTAPTIAAPAAPVASGYGGAVFPVTQAGAGSTAAMGTASYASSAADILKTGAVLVKDSAGIISAAKVISDATGRRRVLPRGADLPAGYTIVGDLPADRNLYGEKPQKDSVSSDGVGFKLPSNSGLLLLALGALAFMKG